MVSVEDGNQCEVAINAVLLFARLALNNSRIVMPDTLNTTFKGLLSPVFPSFSRVATCWRVISRPYLALSVQGTSH
jgi:hypothetical protein